MTNNFNWEQTIQSHATRLAQQLVDSKLRIVFAESCTSGLLATTLGRIPGISETFCGSAVTYRNLTKAGWLGVDEKLLDDPEITAVSEPVAKQMAAGVLKRTPEANLAVAVTGHLGPDAPAEKDGLVYFAILRFDDGEEKMIVHRLLLPNNYPESEGVSLRVARQQDVVGKIIKQLLQFTKRPPE